MNLFEHQAKVIVNLFTLVWNEHGLDADEKALLRLILLNFPNLANEHTGVMLR